VYKRQPVESLGQLITRQDVNYGPFTGGARVIGLRPGIEAFEIDEPPYANVEGEEIDGHAAPLADPDLAEDRAQACFR